MKTKLFLKIAVLSLAFTVSGLCAHSTGVPELDHYKAVYEQEIAKLTTKAQYQRLHIPQDHIKALRKLEAEYQASGDLRNLLAVRNERERFISDPRAELITPVDSPAKLRELQLAYVNNYRVIKAKRKQDARAIRSKYIEVLQRLQKKLTQQNKIEEALVVMKEIESVQNSNGSLRTSTSTLVDASNNADSNDADKPASNSESIDIETIQKLLKGDVSRWNPDKNEITITYDFSDSDQINDWKGGRIEGIYGHLTCNRSVSWLKVQFENIKRVEVDMIPSPDTIEAGMVIGRDLNLKIGKDHSIDGKIYQSGEETPVVEIDGIESTYGKPYENIITINDRQISWSINDKMRHGVLGDPITYPTFIGIGCMTAESAYDKIKITGTLSSQMMQRLKEQVQDN